MTLFDLPGLNYTGGIRQTVQAMVEKYLQNQNAVIIKTVQAQSELVGTQAVEYTEKYDREGKRSLTVVTKIDECVSDENKISELIEKVEFGQA